MKRLGIAGLLALALLVGRVAWGTVYYMDKTKTGGTRSGLDTTNAFTDIDSCLSDLGAYPALAAGDTIKIRPTHTQTLTSNVEHANEGTASNPIVVMGDYNHLIWHSAADSAADRPVFTMGAYYFNLNGDNFWEFRNLSMTGATNRCVGTNSIGLLVANCTFENLAAADDYHIYISAAKGARINDCTFDGGIIGTADANNGRAIYCTGQDVVITNCTFADMSAAGYSADFNVYYIDCSFGQAPDGSNTNDMQSGRNFILGGTLTDNSLLGAPSVGNIVARTYLDASKRPMCYFKTVYIASAISDYGVAHSGGAAYSIKYGVTSSRVGTLNPVKLMEFSVHADSAESRDYTLSCRRDTNWSPAPTAAQLYAECTYALNDTTATAVSTATLTNADTWYDLTVSGVSPSHKGPVIVALWLKTYDNDGYIYVDPELVATGESYNATFNWGLPDLAYAYTGTSSASRFILVN